MPKRLNTKKDKKRKHKKSKVFKQKASSSGKTVKPGSVAIREIKHYQRSTDLVSFVTGFEFSL